MDEMEVGGKKTLGGSFQVAILVIRVQDDHGLQKEIAMRQIEVGKIKGHLGAKVNRG